MGRYKEYQQEEIKQLIDYVANADGIIKYLYFIKKWNTQENKYITVGTADIIPNLDINDTINNTWGDGRYMVSIKSADGQDIKQIGDLKIHPFVVVIGGDENMIMSTKQQTNTVESIDQAMEQRKKTAKDELDCLEMEKRRIIKEHELATARKAGDNDKIDKVTKELEDTKKELTQKTEEIRKEQNKVIETIKEQSRTEERQANNAMFNFAEKMSESSTKQSGEMVQAMATMFGQQNISKELEQIRREQQEDRKSLLEEIKREANPAKDTSLTAMATMLTEFTKINAQMQQQQQQQQAEMMKLVFESQKQPQRTSLLVELLPLLPELAPIGKEILQSLKPQPMMPFKEILAIPTIATLLERILAPKETNLDKILPTIAEGMTKTMFDMTTRMSEVIARQSENIPGQDDPFTKKMKAYSMLANNLTPQISELIRVFATAKSPIPPIPPIPQNQTTNNQTEKNLLPATTQNNYYIPSSGAQEESQQQIDENKLREFVGRIETMSTNDATQEIKSQFAYLIGWAKDGTIDKIIITKSPKMNQVIEELKKL